MNAACIATWDAQVDTTSLLLQERTAFPVTPKEMGKQLRPHKTPCTSIHKDKAQAPTTALCIFKDEGKNPTLCDCSQLVLPDHLNHQDIVIIATVETPWQNS